ncbi:unnamed protein product [Caenorhabditis nigoni]
MVHRLRPTEIVSSEKDPGGARVAYLVSLQLEDHTDTPGTCLSTREMCNRRLTQHLEERRFLLTKDTFVKDVHLGTDRKLMSIRDIET